MEAVKTPVMLYTEQTPNPEAIKFVTNKMLYNGIADFKDASLAKEWSQLATELFDFPYVKSVHFNNNFVTVTKEMNYEWEDILPKLKTFIKEYVNEGKPIIKQGFEAVMAAMEEEAKNKVYEGDEGELIQRIIDLIETYVKPAVAMDGGNIEFKSYDNGIVTVIMQGSCSGCPSSTITLKAGIEGMLTRMIPEVREVISEMG